MIQAQRNRVNQALYQARLLLKAAADWQDELSLLAWQQTCYEAALRALDQARVAFLRELAAVYRLDVRKVASAADLQQLAAARQQRLPELERFNTRFADPFQPLSRLSLLLDELNRAAVPAEAPAAGNWMPEDQPTALVIDRINLIAMEDTNSESVHSKEKKQLLQALDIHQALQQLIQELRETFYED
ncbi:MAG: hypothetical protein IBX50_05250 [Marinospirillum sp.]|uniref:DUF6586 family protein n=1 Tax=Marinospirillum sp. TaxID=2183934 RepID=UPI0019ECE2B8|nr:DUF6586 family protein [Marinospirillum sp.]MBE0506114.1 hypothetical protein [Marinospirillum sp.]